MTNAAIIGAGPMGLAAAYHLGKRGIRCTVFEKEDRPGGMSASIDFEGIEIEQYYHFINLPDTHLFSLLRDLGMENELCWNSTKMGLFRRGPNGIAKLHPWGTPFSLLRLNEIPLITRLRYGFHAFACKFIKNLERLDDISVVSWVTRWEGKNGYDLFWRFLFEKKFFELADPLSAAWIASRIRRVANSRKSLMEEKLGYLARGSASLINCLVREINSQGSELRLSSPVLHFHIEHNRIKYLESLHGKEQYDLVISTIPLPYLPGLALNLPQEYAQRLRKIHNIGCACALFRLTRPLSENFWLNIDIPEWDIPGVIEYSNLRPMGAAYVYIPFYMPQSHPNWKADDEDLLEAARRCLKTINPIAASTEQAARIFRYEYAQPVCPPGFRHLLPPYSTGVKGFWAADTAHSFPEDRSINESVRIGYELCLEVEKNLNSLN